MQVLRRDFLVRSSAAAGALAWMAGQSLAEPTRVPRIDTHLHCFAGANSPEFPYHPRAPYRPVEQASPEFLLSCMDQAGVAHAVVVHPEPYQDDHRYLKHCLNVGKGRLKGTLLLFCDRPGSLEQLPKLVESMPVIALRLHAYAPERLPPFGKPEMRRIWEAATEHGLAVQLHFEPRYAPGFEPLIEEFSQTLVLVDHLGRPFQGTPEEHARVVAWSRFPNVVMKLSSIPSNLNYPHRDILQTLRQLTDAFGAERLMYGGGFRAGCTGESYRAAFDAAGEQLSYLVQAEIDQILGGTAERLFFADASVTR